MPASKTPATGSEPMPTALRAPRPSSPNRRCQRSSSGNAINAIALQTSRIIPPAGKIRPAIRNDPRDASPGITIESHAPKTQMPIPPTISE